MDSLPVTLIVKAPNQQIEDQKIRCETSWTINKLKQHLSEVYPSKPPQHEQKLIYSGQLLTDSLVLKDVLRQYEGQDDTTHTVHLVCTPKLSTMTPPTPANRNLPPTTTNQNVSGNTTRTVSPEQVRPEENRVPNPAFPWAEYQAQINLNAMNQYQIQMALMQQAYMQYMAQYMQYASLNQQQPPLGTTPQADPQPNEVQQPPAPAPQENEERDWLDVFYMLSRALVLFSVVYFYSSPIRFIFVLFLGVGLYLYQAGFFRNITINNNHIDGTPEGAQQEDQAPTWFTLAWTFITTFFASLVPEIPNINA